MLIDDLFVKVEFKGNRREIFLNNTQSGFRAGDYAVVEVESGLDLGTIRTRVAGRAIATGNANPKTVIMATAAALNPPDPLRQDTIIPIMMTRKCMLVMEMATAITAKRRPMALCVASCVPPNMKRSIVSWKTVRRKMRPWVNASNWWSSTDSI